MALMGSINKPCRISDIRARGADAGLKALASWNFGPTLCDEGPCDKYFIGTGTFRSGKTASEKTGYHQN